MARTKAPAPITIMALPGRRSDYRVTQQHLNGSGTRSLGGNRFTIGGLAENGARDFRHDDENGLLRFKIGGGARTYEAMVKLTPDDTYAVEIGRTRKVQGIPTYTVLVQRAGIYAEQLRRTMRDMHAEVSA